MLKNNPILAQIAGSTVATIHLLPLAEFNFEAVLASDELNCHENDIVALNAFADTASCIAEGMDAAMVLVATATTDESKELAAKMFTAQAATFNAAMNATFGTPAFFTMPDMENIGETIDLEAADTENKGFMAKAKEAVSKVLDSIIAFLKGIFTKKGQQLAAANTVAEAKLTDAKDAKVTAKISGLDKSLGNTIKNSKALAAETMTFITWAGKASKAIKDGDALGLEALLQTGSSFSMGGPSLDKGKYVAATGATEVTMEANVGESDLKTIAANVKACVGVIESIEKVDSKTGPSALKVAVAAGLDKFKGENSAKANQVIRYIGAGFNFSVSTMYKQNAALLSLAGQAIKAGGKKKEEDKKDK